MWPIYLLSVVYFLNERDSNFTFLLLRYLLTYVII